MENNRIFWGMIIVIAILIILNIVQCSNRKDVVDAQLDAVSQDRINTAWDALGEIQVLLEAAEDSIARKDSIITALEKRRPKRHDHYDTIYIGIRDLSSGERDIVLADRRTYLEALRERRMATITD